MDSFTDLPLFHSLEPRSSEKPSDLEKAPSKNVKKTRSSRSRQSQSTPSSEKNKALSNHEKKPKKLKSKSDQKSQEETEESQKSDALFSTERRPYSVSDITQRVKESLERDFVDIWVKGEISNSRPASSGHLYLTLKDSSASLSAVFFGWGRKKTRFALKDGIQVLCHGRISVYPPRGSYQIVLDEIQPLGAGALQIEFERLKARLSEEGLFDRDAKKSLPRFPKKVAFVTSPSGAAIQDILNVLGRRAGHVDAFVCPCLVQGEGAGKAIAEQIQWLNRLDEGIRPELIVVTRGGGSIEDLWAFNEEIVARSIFESTLPVLSAVGHEIDFTISDFVADLRAPTPSAAAELLSQHWVESQQVVSHQFDRLQSSGLSYLKWYGEQVKQCQSRLKSPKDRLRDRAQRNDELMLRLEQAMARRVIYWNDQLRTQLAQLNVLSPLNVLERGFAIVHPPNKPNEIIKSVQQMQKENEVEIRFRDGKVAVRKI